MKQRSTNPLLLTAVLAMVFASAAIPAAAQRAETGPFAGLTGSWSGEGSVKLANGTSERIRCRAAYAVDDGGAGLRQNLRCASDSYKFDLNSDVGQQNGNISGAWNETTRGATGQVSGRASGAQIQVRVSSPLFTADVSMVTRDNRQQVTIRSPGSELEEVTIALVKGGK